MKSFSEIDTTVKRASKSIGFEWGVAEELGKNIRLLEMFGLAGLKNLNSYFKIYNQKQFQKISLISKINTSWGTQPIFLCHLVFILEIL